MSVLPMPRQKYKFHSLLHAADLVEDRLRVQLAPLGIRPRQARILNALRRMGTASQVELASEFNVTAGSMSTMIARLMAMNLVSRTKAPEELRTDVLQLTPQGLTLLKKIHTVWRQINTMLEDALGQEKADMLGVLTSELKFALGGHIPGQKNALKTSLKL